MQSQFMIVRWTAAIAVAALITSPNLHAAATSSFDNLRAELVSRANSLTGSVDKVEQKQGKTCLKVIAAIDKSTTLSGDIKALGKVAKTLAKAFPNDFIVEAAVTHELTAVDLSDLLEGSLSNLVATIQADLDEIQTEIDALSPGSAKTSAQTAHDAAQDLLNQAGTSPDFALAAKALSSSLKSLLSAIKTIDKANNSGGGGGGGSGPLSCKINGSSFSALGAAATFTTNTMEFAVAGSSLQKTVSIIAFGVTGPGNYAAHGGVAEIIGGVIHAGNPNGTIHIATFNLAQQKASGTFSFSVSQTSPVIDTNSVINLTEGSFNITTIIPVNFP